MNKSYSKIRHIQESNIRLEKRMLNEQTVPDYEGPLKLSDLKKTANRDIWRTGIQYRGYIGGERLKGKIVMTSEFSEMSKKNGWKYPQAIEIDFSEAQPYTVSGSPVFNVGSVKSGGEIKNDYGTIYFKWADNLQLPDGTHSPTNSPWVFCSNSETDNLYFIIASDGKWYYICTN